MTTTYTTSETLERVPRSTKATKTEMESDADVLANIPGQVVCSGKAEDAPQETEITSFQETVVHRFAEFIDDHHKPKRLEDFTSEFKSCFETEDYRLATMSNWATLFERHRRKHFHTLLQNRKILYMGVI